MPLLRQRLLRVGEEWGRKRRDWGNWSPPWVWGGGGERAGRLGSLLSSALSSRSLTRACGGDGGHGLRVGFSCPAHSHLSKSMGWLYSKLTCDHKRNMLLAATFWEGVRDRMGSDSRRSAGLPSSRFRRSGRNVQY